MAATVSFPFTSNNLDAGQRARLMRSAKKLGEVLGTTPHLLEISPDISVASPPVNRHRPSPSLRSPDSIKAIKSSRRCGSIFGHPDSSSTSISFPSPASSVTSLTIPQSSHSSSSSVDLHVTQKATRKPSVSHRPRPLVLHLNPVPLSPSDPRVAVLPPTPNSAADVFKPVTPNTDASLAEKQAAEARRRKMAKVTRTLGENVPHELVFPTQKPTLKQKIRNRNRRSLSVSDASQPVKWTTGPIPSSEGALGSWVGEWNRRDIKDVQKQLRHLKAR